MAHIILAEVTASVSELKKNPMGTVAAGEGFPVAAGALFPIRMTATFTDAPNDSYPLTRVNSLTGKPNFL